MNYYTHVLTKTLYIVSNSIIISYFHSKNFIKTYRMEYKKSCIMKFNSLFERKTKIKINIYRKYY